MNVSLTMFCGLIGLVAGGGLGTLFPQLPPWYSAPFFGLGLLGSVIILRLRELVIENYSGRIGGEARGLNDAKRVLPKNDSLGRAIASDNWRAGRSSADATFGSEEDSLIRDRDKKRTPAG
jgi:hypothetical protein